MPVKAPLRLTFLGYMHREVIKRVNIGHIGSTGTRIWHRVFRASALEIDGKSPQKGVHDVGLLLSG
jgi:hypothetical protein